MLNTKKHKHLSLLFFVLAGLVIGLLLAKFTQMWAAPYASIGVTLFLWAGIDHILKAQRLPTKEDTEIIPAHFKTLVKEAFFRLQPGWDCLDGFDEDIARRNAESATETYLDELTAFLKAKGELEPLNVSLNMWLMLFKDRAWETDHTKNDALADFINSTFNDDDAPLIAIETL